NHTTQTLRSAAGLRHQADGRYKLMERRVNPIAVLCVKISLRVGYFENEFSRILALEELQQRFGECFEALYDVLARFESAGCHPRRHLPSGFRITISIVKYDHTFH